MAIYRCSATHTSAPCVGRRAVIPCSRAPVVRCSGGPVVRCSTTASSASAPRLQRLQRLHVHGRRSPNPLDVQTASRSSTRLALTSGSYQTCRIVPQSSNWCRFLTNIKGAQSDTRATEVSNSGITWLTRLTSASVLTALNECPRCSSSCKHSGFIAVHCP